MNEYELDALQNEMAEGCDCIPEVTSSREERRLHGLIIGATSVQVRHEDRCKIARRHAARHN